MERTLAYIDEMKEDICHVFDLPLCTNEASVSPGNHDPSTIIALLRNHLEAVLASTSNGPLDVASVMGSEETTVPSSSEQDPAARRRGNAQVQASVKAVVVRSEQEPAARCRKDSFNTDVSCYISPRIKSGRRDCHLENHNVSYKTSSILQCTTYTLNLKR